MSACLCAATVALAPTAAYAHADKPCAPAEDLMQQRELDKARDALVDLTAQGQSNPCVAADLKTIKDARVKEAGLCALGDKVAKSDATEARHDYIAAYDLNLESACATKGIAALDKKSTWFSDARDGISSASKAAVSLGQALLILLALGLLVMLVIAGRRRSLVISDFSDGASEAKVGAAVTALIQRQLIGLGRKSHPDADYVFDLDKVVADVELLAREDDLSGAVAGLAQTSQLGLVTAVVTLIERVTNRRYAAAGELLIAGTDGPGVALAVLQRNAVQARGVLWEDEVEAWLGQPVEPPGPPPAPVAPPPAQKKAAPPSDPDPQPYYALAVPAAAWIQYAVAIQVGNVASIFTDSPQSFTLVGVALERERAEQPEQALRAYARALEFDADNVAALNNAALLLIREYGLLGPALTMFERARIVLKKRYGGTV